MKFKYIIHKFYLLFFNPALFVKKLKTTISDLIDRYHFKSDECLKKQNTLYEDVGLNRKQGIDLLVERGIEFDREQQILFAAVASHAQTKIKTILEIGTFTGKSSSILARLFPDSRIDTIDLADDDEMFTSTYGRENFAVRKKFIEDRTRLLSQHKNIEF